MKRLVLRVTAHRVGLSRDDLWDLDVTGDDPIVTGKIALAHMKEFPDYYERLARMEREAEAESSQRRT